MKPFIKRLIKKLQHQNEKNLIRCIETTGSCRIDLTKNDYLCLRKHPNVLVGAETAQRQFGTGTGASPLISGFLPCHKNLLTALKNWKGKPNGILFNSGFIANQAILKHLPGPNDLILLDKLSHHSIIQAVLSGNVQFKSYPHLNLDRLEELLIKNIRQYETIFVITESVFSMDGDYPDLKRIANLKEKYPFILILDEAHAVGCFGPTGGGLAEAEDVLDSVDILVGTLSKALGSMGGYVLTSSIEVIDYLVNFAGELIYSTFIPPAQAGAALSAIELVRSLGKVREYPRKLGTNFRIQLRQAGWETNSFDSQIVPIIIGDNSETLKIKNILRNVGICVGAVRPPTVSPGKARLRLSLHAETTPEHIKELINILNSCRNL